MGRGWRTKTDPSGVSANGMRGGPQDKVAGAHYAEHQENFWNAIRGVARSIREARGPGGLGSALHEGTDRIGRSLGADGEGVRSGLARVGLIGLAAGAGAVTISPAAALLAPAAGAALAWKAYNSWNTAHLWRNSTIGKALAESFGVNRAGKINSIGDTLAKRSLSGLGVAGASTLTLGTPLAPVAAAAIAGYTGYKAVQVAANKRSIEKEGADNEFADPSEPSDEGIKKEPTSEAPDTSPNTPAEETGEPDTSSEAPVEGGTEIIPEEVPVDNSDDSESSSEDAAPENNPLEEAPQDNPDDEISPIDRIALEQVAKIEAEAELVFQTDVSSELGQVAVAEGRNFAEGMNSAAAEASMLSLLAESEFIPEDESGDQIRTLVATNIQANILNADEIKAIKAELEEADNIKNQCIDNLQQINVSLEEIKASAHIDPEEVQSLIEEREEYIQAGINAEAKGNRIRAEVQSFSSPFMSQIGGIANLSTLGGELRCARCGTKPQTVRHRCSKCGLPFIVSPNQRQYVGVGDEGLREMGKMDLVEQYEGDSETRELRRKARLDGKYIYFPPGGEGAEIVGQNGKSPSKKNYEGATKKSPGAANSSSNSTGSSSREAVRYSKWSAEDTIASFQPQGDYDRDKYLADQASLRNGDAPERAVFLVGHDPTTKGAGGKNAKLNQSQAMMRGALGWDWNKSGEAIQPGDTVAVRNNKKGKKPSSIAGFFTVGDKIELILPSMNEIAALEDGGEDLIYSSKGYADPAGVEQMLRKHRPEIMAALENVADKVMEGTDAKYYSRERVIGNILGDLANTQSSTFSFLQVTDPHELEDYQDEALQGGKDGLGTGTATLNGPDKKGVFRIQRTKQVRESEEKSAAAEKLMRTIEEKRADDVESNKGSYPENNFNRDSKGLPRVCGVKTATKTPCRNRAARGSNYCWQHQSGPRKDLGEKKLSREEINSSARDARNKELLEKAPAVIRGQKEAEAYISSLDNSPSSESNKKLIAQCGMTHRELAEYANSFLDACRPDEKDTVAVQLTHMDQIPLAKEIAKVAEERGISHELWYPTGDQAEIERREDIVKDPRVISASIDQVGSRGERVIEDKNNPHGYRPMVEGEAYQSYIETSGRWNATMTPTSGWAQLLAENHELTGFSKDPEKALRQLGQDLHHQSYSHEGIQGLRRHVEDLDAKAARMRDLNINKIRIHSPAIDSLPGTELTMEMTDKSQWMSVDVSDEKEDVLLNTVTEEVWGTPVAGSLRGYFTTSAPTNIAGAADPGAEPVIIEQLRGEFDDEGELRKLRAYKQDKSGDWVEDKEGQKNLEAYFWPGDNDTRAGRPTGEDGQPAPFPQCGELGIVDSENPVGRTGRRYLVPMIDEHGGLHIALGQSYAMNGGGGSNGASLGPGDEQDPRNPCGHHLDITLGSMNASVFGISDKTGEEVAVIDKGRFAI